MLPCGRRRTAHSNATHRPTSAVWNKLQPCYGYARHTSHGLSTSTATYDYCTVVLSKFIPPPSLFEQRVANFSSRPWLVCRPTGNPTCRMATEKVVAFMLLVGDWRNASTNKDAKMYDFNNQVRLQYYVAHPLSLFLFPPFLLSFVCLSTCYYSLHCKHVPTKLVARGYISSPLPFPLPLPLPLQDLQRTELFLNLSLHQPYLTSFPHRPCCKRHSGR